MAKGERSSFNSFIDIQNNNLDTKRPSSYNKQKKIISRNTTLKVSRTSKDETMVNIIERKIMQRLKETERAKFDENVLEQRFQIIQECMNISICKLNYKDKKLNLKF